MGILLFALSMAALALMSTTRESRATAKQEYAYMTKHFNRARAIYFDSESDFSDVDLAKTYLIWSAACDCQGDE